jgi:hypothetical protein
MLSVEENKPNFDLDHIDLDINHPAIRYSQIISFYREINVEKS